MYYIEFRVKFHTGVLPDLVSSQKGTSNINYFEKVMKLTTSKSLLIYGCLMKNKNLESMRTCKKLLIHIIQLDIKVMLIEKIIKLKN